MRRGKINHKGRARKFTSPEELEQERRAEQAKQWRSKNEQEEEKSSSEEESGSGSESGSESGSDDDKPKKVAAAGASAIDVENPNRVAQKTKKVTELDTVAEAKPQLSRREREELEKQRAREHYQKLHAAGKTEEARADLARLAIIKKQREEAAKKREEERLQKEAEKAAKSASISKALGKKS